MSAGKGVDAAVVTGLTRYVLRSAAVSDDDPVQVLHNLHSVLGQKFGGQPDRFCTVIYGNFTKRDNGFDVELASGGHLPPLLLHADGSADYVDSIGGHAVGLVAEPHFIATRFHLAPGDTLVLYTDGLTEASTGVGRERVSRPRRAIGLRAIDRTGDGVRNRWRRPRVTRRPWLRGPGRRRCTGTRRAMPNEQRTMTRKRFRFADQPSAGEQLLKCVLHAFGVPGRVRQGVAIRSSADRQGSVVARNDMDKVQAADQRPETGDAYESSAAEEDRFGWTRHIGHGRVGDGGARERKRARGLRGHPEQ